MPSSREDPEERLLRWLDRFRLAHPMGEPHLVMKWASEQPELEGQAAFVDQLEAAAAAHIKVEKIHGVARSEEEEASLSFFGHHDLDEEDRTDTSRLEPGQRIGRFQLRSFISKGGMGQVWKAVDQDLQRMVALKLVLPDRIRGRDLDQFLREARAGGRVQHRNIVTTLAYGTDDGLPWIAQELIEGAWTLKDFLVEQRKSEALPKTYYRDVAALVAEIADGIQVAHEAGVIHRDIKPANILINSDDVPKVADFGLARVADDSFHSVTGEFAGTWAYMSPEQVTAKRIGMDHRTDVFSLGVVLYELLALRRPFEGDTAAQIAERILFFDPPEASTVRSQCPVELALICGKALQKSPDARYESMAEFAADLRRHLADQPIIAKPPSLTQKCLKWSRRNPNKTVAAGVASIALVVVSLLALRLADALGDSRVSEALAQRQAGELEVERKKVLAALESVTEERRRAEAERADVLRLSQQQDLDDLLAEVDDLWPPHPENIPALRSWLERAERLLEDLPLHEAKREELRALALPADQAESAEQAADQREWAFPEDREKERWWNSQLSQLIGGLELLRDELLNPERVSASSLGAPQENELPWGWSVGKRLAFAERLEAGFAPGGEFDAVWQRDLPAIRASHPSLSELEPQLGLVPIGVDPGSGLWEFADLATGSVPTRGSGGELVRDEETALVMVLIPGGTFLMGAQTSDPEAPNYDPQAHDYETPPHEVSLSPYFLSKYEMTQGQWLAATGAEPSLYQHWDHAPSLLHPVEQVSWSDCVKVCARIGLELPTEAQWEHGARAGSGTPWHLGADKEALRGKLNIADKTAADVGAVWPAIQDWPDHEDGGAVHVEVGFASYPPNDFGLHEVHGNVWEWCADGYDPEAYQREGAVDPLVPPEASAARVTRGGSFYGSARDARLANRGAPGLGTRDNALGLRPARKVHP